MGTKAPIVERLALSDTVFRLAEAAGYPRIDITREMLAGLHRIKPREEDLLRSVERQLAEGRVLSPEDADRVNTILRRAIDTPAAKRRPPLSVREVVEDPEILRGRSPDEVRGLFGLHDTPLWQPGYGHWSATNEASGLHLQWTPEAGWTHRVGDRTTHIPVETRVTTAQLFVRPSGDIPEVYRSRVKASGLPVIDGGQLSVRGSRTQARVLSTEFSGYHRFVMPDGRRVFSMEPIEGDAFRALDVIRHFEQHTGRTDIMAKPLGIHLSLANHGSFLRIWEEVGFHHRGAI